MTHRFECANLCGQVFDTRSLKETHMVSCPVPLEPVACSFGCGQSFSRRGTLRHKQFCELNPERIAKRTWTRAPSPTLDLKCSECGETFTKRNNGAACKDGLHRCDACKKNVYKTRYSGKNRERRLMRNYGLSNDAYARLLDIQGGVCAICKQAPDAEENLPVDHDHATGKVRGLLCHSCNRAIGQLQDDPKNLRAAASYLLRHDTVRSWDAYFLEIAQLVATRSKDPSSQVGAVIVRERNILSTGYNGFPRGVNDSVPERYERPAKYKWTIHGEENAILNASRNGTAVEGATLYVTPFAPCVECAKAIVQSGVVEVVVDARINNPRWTESFVDASELLKAARVLVRGPE